MSQTWAGLQSGLKLLVIFAVWLASAGAYAQTAQETALARTLFEEGVALADQAQWEQAADRFRRAYALKPTPGIAFNLASALGETGKLIDATEMLEALARDPATTGDLRRDVEAKLALLTPRKAYLTLQVENAPNGEAEVVVDGQPWPRAAWGIASPIDPGRHEVVASAAGDLSTREEIEIAQGERRELTLVIPSPPPPPAPVLPPQAPAPKRSEKQPLYKNWMLWAGVGAAVVAGTVTAVLLTTGGETERQAPIRGNLGVATW